MKSPIILYEPPKRARTDYRTGLSAWTDKSLLDEGMFYTRKTMTAEERCGGIRASSTSWR